MNLKPKATRTRWLGTLLLLAGVAVTATGMGVLFRTSPHWYVATARVIVKPLNEDDTNYIYDPFFLQKEFEVIQSPAVVSNAIAQLDFQTPGGCKLGFLKELTPAEACALLQSSFNVRPIRSTSLVDINVSHDDPDAAATIANALAKAYCDLPPERRRHYTEEEFAELEADTHRADSDRAYRDWAKASLLAAQAAQEGRLIRRVKVEMIDPATPPASQVSLEQRLSRWLHPGYYRPPGPPAHPHGPLSLGLLVLGLALGAVGLVLLARRTA